MVNVYEFCNFVLMKKIQMVDLKGQYEAIKETINTSVLNVIESTAFINGPEVHSFQKNLENYLNVKHVIPCANGTDALQIAMMGLGLQPGDEVITADFTFAATVEVIALLQLTPVLVDVNPDDFNNIILCTPVYLQGISPPIKAVIKEFPLKGKKVTVLATCGGMYFSVFHSLVKWSLNRRGANVSGVYVVKVGGKTEEEIKKQTKGHLQSAKLLSEELM